VGFQGIGLQILMLIVCLSVVSTIFTFACGQEDTACYGSFDNSIILNLFNLDTDQLDKSGGISLTSDFSSTIKNSTTPAAGGVEVSGGIGVFLDGLKMVLGFITLFTPIPLLDFLNSTGFPLWVTMIIGIPLFVAWFVGFAQLIRGAIF
jgi:hypothetical protein